jgi:ubiquinone/menaquinone biosynthesis C-methylase UbiE
MHNSTNRFSDRVENYIRYRPGYPGEIVPFLRSQIDLQPSATLADIGSGTGILTRMFLENGNTLYGIEPNAAMREAAEKLLASYDKFVSVAGTAESTTLPDSTIDHILAAQAFHWFDIDSCRCEFRRILRGDGNVVLLWNERKVDTPFAIAYEDLLLRFGTDYRQIDHRNIDENVLSQFFKEEKFILQIFDNFQDLDYDGLKGRLLSASYVPSEGHKSFPAMIGELEEMFERFQQDGRVRMDYETKMYLGKV